jgi:hypothetical protein
MAIYLTQPIQLLDPKTKFLSLRIRISCLIRRRKALDFSEFRPHQLVDADGGCVLIMRSVNVSGVG